MRWQAGESVQLQGRKCILRLRLVQISGGTLRAALADDGHVDALALLLGLQLNNFDLLQLVVQHLHVHV